MQEIALHIMDLVENSIRSRATRIEVDLEEDPEGGRLVVGIRDDGCGMDHRARRRAADPFFTTREGKRVGLGLALFAQAAEESGGTLRIESAPGRGTWVQAVFDLRHPDCKPLGDVQRTIELLRAAHPQIDFVYRYLRLQGGQP